LARRFAPRELRRIDAQPSEMRRAVATEARWADLFVGTCPRGGAEKWNSVIEEVLFQGGRGVFLAPEAIKPRAAIRTVAFAWKDTREAARALAEAMPFLRIATSTHVIVVDEGAARLDAGPRMADIASHLARHGVSAKVDLATQAAGGTAASILDAAHRAGADLIVSGAYGHSRLREWILGGVTRALIETSDIPLLMAH
jgi:nucleotide-binding universal stress UspA family protein